MYSQLVPSSGIVAVMVVLPSATPCTIPVEGSTVAMDVLAEEYCMVPVGDTVLVAILLLSEYWVSPRLKVLLVKVMEPVRSAQLLHSMQKAVLGRKDVCCAVYVVDPGVRSDILVELYMSPT